MLCRGIQLFNGVCSCCLAPTSHAGTVASIRVSSSLLSHSSSSSSSSNNTDISYLTPTLARVQAHLQHTKIALDQPSRTSTSRDHSSTNSFLSERHDTQSIFIDGLAANKLGLDPYQNSRHAPMVYHELYSCPNWPEKHTFPMEKFHQTAVSLLNDPDEYYVGGSSNNRNKNNCYEEDDEIVTIQQLVLSQDHFYRPLPMEIFPTSFLSPPVCSNYLQSFLSGTLSTEDCRLIGFREQTSRPELIERTVLEVAGTLLTAQLAMKYGLASNLAGGTHHAEWNRGKGYTILNDLAVVAHLMTWREGVELNEVVTSSSSDGIPLLRELYRGEGVVDRVLVVDCDVHQGDGTATFSKSIATRTTTASSWRNTNLHNRLFTLDLHAAKNYPHPKEACTYDIGFLDGCNDEVYLSTLAHSLDRALREVQPQLVLYNAGVDVFEGDKLGRLSLTTQGIKRRDYHVIRTCVDAEIPIAVVVGGGYDNDVRELGRRHALVHRVCANVWRENTHGINEMKGNIR